MSGKNAGDFKGGGGDTDNKYGKYIIHIDYIKRLILIDSKWLL
jgi:hypothetical protein